MLIGQDGQLSCRVDRNRRLTWLDIPRASEPFGRCLPTSASLGRCACRRALYLGQHRTAEGRCEQSTQPAPARPAICGCMPHRCRRRLHASERPHDDRRLQRDAVRLDDGRKTAHRGCRGSRPSRPAASDPIAAGDDYIIVPALLRAVIAASETDDFEFASDCPGRRRKGVVDRYRARPKGGAAPLLHPDQLFVDRDPAERNGSSPTI